jgi:hypothetical protein
MLGFIACHEGRPRAEATVFYASQLPQFLQHFISSDLLCALSPFPITPGTFENKNRRFYSKTSVEHLITARDTSISSPERPRLQANREHATWIEL